MASLFFDQGGTGWWAIKYKAGDVEGFVKKRLCHHAGWKRGQPIPKRPSDEAKALAAVYEKLERDIKHGIKAAPTRTPLGPYLDAYLADARRGGKAENTLECIGRSLRRFAAFANARNLDAIQQVTPSDCRAYLSARGNDKNHYGEPVGLSTLALDRAYLNPVFKQAELDGLIVRNPWAHIRVPKSREAHARKAPSFWTPAEVDRIADGCAAAGRPWVRDIFLIGVNTGLRISALLGLQWAWVDFSEGNLGQITLPAENSKGKRAVAIPLSTVAHEILARLAAERPRDGGPLVFRGPIAGKRIRPQTFGRWLREISKAVGLPYQRTRICHKMRHTFGTIAANNPAIALPTLKGWMGHSKLEMTQRYVHEHQEESHRQMGSFSLGQALPPASQPAPPIDPAAADDDPTPSEPSQS